MRFAYLAVFHDRHDAAARVHARDLATIVEVVRATPALADGLIFTPEQAADPYLDDGPPPQLGLQLDFPSLEALEAAVAPAGHLQALARPWRGLDGCEVTQQAMYVRRFPVPRREAPADPAKRPCSYVVHYPGPAQDFNAWIKAYLAHHPATMARMPGIRAIEILTRVDWCDSMPWPRVHHMQRNRVTFDDAEALSRALRSPVRDEMRRHFLAFPPYTGGNAHYPMHTLRVMPQP